MLLLLQANISCQTNQVSPIALSATIVQVVLGMACPNLALQVNIRLQKELQSVLHALLEQSALGSVAAYLSCVLLDEYVLTLVV